MRTSPTPLAWLAVVLVGCGGCGAGGDGNGPPGADGIGVTGSGDDRPASCPAAAEAPHPLPGVRAEHRTLAYWLERSREQGDPDEVLLDVDGVRSHQAALALPVADRTLGRVDLVADLDRASIAAEIEERLAFLREKLEGGGYLTARGERVEAAVLAPFAAPLPPLTPRTHLAEAPIPVRCGPVPDRFFTEALDLRFDRNNCSTVRQGEVIQVLATWEGGMRLARTGYTLGWIAPEAPLSAVIDAEQARARLALEPRPLTRRALLEGAFALLDAPYGWGGQDGGRDCSRFLMDVFERFGIGLPRHSGRQALAGTFSVDVSEVRGEREKLLLVDSAARRGAVLLHFPGHIMLYLGRTEEGTPMAIHAFAEYLEPCEGVTLEDGAAPETLRKVDRVTVSDLSLGRGTSRTSFVERLTRITVLGKPPGPELGGAATLRASAPVEVPAAEACRDSLEARIFQSPATPHAQAPLRVIATLSEDPGPVDLLLVGPDGARVALEARRLGGPPFTYWAQVDAPAPGRWTAVLGDGPRTVACKRFGVRPHAPTPAETERDAHAWTPRWRWEADTHNLYAAWVEQLFDYPIEEDRTWPDLQTLLRDADRNILYGHLSQQEESQIRLGPDCADLPYFLRAYFSWKLKLPFAFRRCSRGNHGNAPRCNALNTTLVERQGTGEVGAFSLYVRDVANGVHSASARTLPRDENTDVYPVAMTREAIVPGTVYADPYGHLLVVAGWIPQGLGTYGILVGVDAQPDGTIGRRRFWRGSFLFSPETSQVGAGFKAWRPLVHDPRAGTLTALDNATLARTDEHPRWSLQQYEGSADDFYDRMEALINPRPLEPSAMQGVLVDALAEAVARRIVSVNNGVEHMRGRRWAPIEMPSGYAVFETTGAWEDYATPARDMRLLISIDAVRGFADAVERAPERFGLTEEEAPAVVARLREELSRELGQRSFAYTRSDGSEQTLTLAEVLARAERFEMSYHPNDCVEIRWAAAPGTDEMATCNHHAPAEHRARMERYREWFRDRRRPPR